MDDMRSEIRAAFEKEQAAHPPGGGLRTNLVSAAATQSRPKPNLQWITVAVAAVLGLLIVAGLMSTRLGPRANVPGNPKASSVRLSSPTPGVDYGTPPSGVPLLYLHDPSNTSWLIGYDWSGKPRGTVKLPADLGQDPSAVKMKPDGSGFEVGGTYKGGTGVFLDALGQPIISEIGTPDRVGAMWADDMMHQCVLTFSSTYVWRLGTQLPGHTLSPVAVIARDKDVGQSGISLAACSFQSDRAILMRTVISSMSEVWVLRLSDGKVLAHHAFGIGGANIVASSDAAYVSVMPGTGADVAPGAVGASIMRVSDWTVVGTVRVANVWGFSGDDSLLLADQLQAPQSRLEVVDWRSGAALWHDQGTTALATFLAKPAGRDFAVALTDLSGGTPDQATILIIHGDGSVAKFPRRYQPTW
jgi:hypothetical protein